MFWSCIKWDQFIKKRFISFSKFQKSLIFLVDPYNSINLPLLRYLKSRLEIAWLFPISKAWLVYRRVVIINRNTKDDRWQKMTLTWWLRRQNEFLMVWWPSALDYCWLKPTLLSELRLWLCFLWHGDFRLGTQRQGWQTGRGPGHWAADHMICVDRVTTLRV